MRGARWSGAALVLALLTAPTARAAEAEPPAAAFDTTGTSTTTEPPRGVIRRVEHRLFAKSDHLILRTGFSYLSRADFYASPGVTASATWYLDEWLGLDLLSATFFFSERTEAAAAVERETGYVPDSQRPILRATAGARFAFAYGKLLLEALDSVVHLDASAFAHAGVLVTDEAPNLGGDLGLSVQLRAREVVLVFAEIGWLGSYEDRRNTSFASGLLAAFGLGVVL